ncbi:class I adenylate-forming enzyme family protein [Frigidibacter sp. ROC022]|uniref:class I adenylate-forming enzyme family protein n=1 Tax=Frigidibacter sp. ROC022 TaxID=2971796 RepID=UPI00215A3130|nr:class I adenylate-forming enzyme family protein [Frigidibacter sp. ROC022]MCR8725617.1 acyl--CoA ligase [Frigidibacter sp. ROC022]
MTSPTPSWPAPPTPFNMAAHVLARAGALADKVALSLVSPDGAEDWSYGRLETAVRGTATGLLARGLEPGDRVLLRLGNSVDFPVAYLGAIAAGLVPVPSSAQLTGPEITRMARVLAPKLVIAAAGIALPELTDVPVLDQEALRQMRTLPPAAYAMGDPDRPAYAVFTSGTSGVSRAVLHAHRAIWARGMMTDGWYGLRQDDRLLHAGAFNWTYTLGTGLMDPWTAGATALIPVEGVTSAELGALLARHDATLFAAAPGVYRQMLRGNLPALPALRHGLTAGEKLPEITRAHWVEATGTALHEAYGMSECSTFISGSPDRPAPPGTLGYPQPGRRIAVLGDDGPVPAGTPGVLAIHRSDPGLMLGYLNAPEETAARFRGDWFLTGDVVSQGADGAITYQGRDDDMMNAGGFRVSPVEVEAALNRHPEVLESAAVELQIKADASVIAAFYTADRDLPEAELTAFLADHLAHYKMPRLFRRIPEIPRGANNKLLRRALRDRAKET